MGRRGWSAVVGLWLLAAGVGFAQDVAGVTGLPESAEAVSSRGAGGGGGSRKLEVVSLYDRPIRPFSDYGMSVKVGSLGVGFEVVTTLLRNWNLRGGASFVDFGHLVVHQGVNYNGELHYRSGQVNVDWFPRHGGFHVSPGVLFFRSNMFGVLAVPGGGTYTLNDTVYTSSATDPIRGVAQLSYHGRVAPSLMIGFGNIIPRGSKRWTVPVEFGAAYVGAPRLTVRLAGQACQPDGCFNVGTDPDSQFNLRQDVGDINETLKRIPVYPLLSVGVGYRF